MKNIKNLLLLLIVQGLFIQAAEESKIADIDNLSDSYWAGNKRKADEVKNTIHQNSSSKKIRQESYESTLINQAILIDSDKPMELTEDILFQLHKNCMNNVLQELQELQAKVRWKRNKNITNLLLDSWCQGRVVEMLVGYAGDARSSSEVSLPGEKTVPWVIAKQRYDIVQAIYDLDYDQFKKSCGLLDACTSLFISPKALKSSDFIKKYRTKPSASFRLGDNQGHRDQSLLHINKNSKIACHLLQVGIDINLGCGHFNEVPLHKAIKDDNIKLVKTLLDYQADIEAISRWKETSLHVAAVCCNIEIMQMLIDYQANVHARNWVGNVPLDLVFFPSMNSTGCRLHGKSLRSVAYDDDSTRASAALLLINNGAIVNNVDNDDRTSLEYALIFDNIATAQVLLDHGATINFDYDHSRHSRVRTLLFELRIKQYSKSPLNLTFPSHEMKWKGIFLLGYLVIHKSEEIELIKVLLDDGVDIDIKKDDFEDFIRFINVNGQDVEQLRERINLKNGFCIEEIANNPTIKNLIAQVRINRRKKWNNLE